FGSVGAVSGYGSNNLWEDANETRVLGAELTPPSSGTAVIRHATVVVNQFYDVMGTREDTLGQDVVGLYLSDTTITRYGPGWTLAEQSRLFLGQTMAGVPAAIWLSGDGSYMVFKKISNVWVSPPGVTAKLTDISGTQETGADYVISLSSGNRLGFLPSGYQAWAADMIGNKSTYLYTGTRLIRVTDPTGASMRFQYYTSGAVGQVKEVYAKGPGQPDSTKMATLAYDANKRLSRVDLWIGASQSDSTLFGYMNTATGAFLTTITDPRSVPATPIITTFTYDTVTWTPVQVQRPPAKSGAGSIASFRDQWRRAFPRAGYGRHLPSPAPAQLADRLVYPQQLRGTNVGFEGPITDFTVDRFGGPTWVRVIAPEPPLTFPPTPSGGDVVRRIDRDSVGRVLTIVAAPDSATLADSVMYQYDALGRPTRMIRRTPTYPLVVGNPTLDSVTFTYDSVTVSGAVTTGGAWCSRLLKTRGALGSFDTTVTRYGASGAAKCLPTKIIGSLADTTIFTYSTLAISNAAATRPVSVRDPNGLSESVSYNSTSWNTATHTRDGDAAVTTMIYNSTNGTGRPDSVVDPVGVRTMMLYDRLGRVTYQKTGTGLLAPVTHTIYLPGGLASETQVFAANDNAMGTPVGQVQSSKTFFDRLGQVDSALSPGSRSPVKVGRKQSFQGYTRGQPTYTFPGNGTFIGRIYDWLGRTRSIVQNGVNPAISYDGEPFADAATNTFYNTLNLGVGPNLSAGQVYSYAYDNLGRMIGETGIDLYLRDTLGTHHKGYAASGALLADTVTYTGGLRVIRRYEYNRRGQRTVAADTVQLLGSGTLTGERSGKIVYGYNTISGRLDSLQATVDSGGAPREYARIYWYYDRGGRDTLHVVWLKPTSGTKISTRTTYDAAGRVASITTSQPGTTWYSFGSPNYSKVDELTVNSATEPHAGGPVTYTNTYATDGTRRLKVSNRAVASLGSTATTWEYDVFGNRARELRNSTMYTSPGTCNNLPDTLLYASTADNRLLSRTRIGCTDKTTYYTDQVGNRVAQRDTLNGGVTLRTQKLTYTAANELYFSMTATEALGVYDANWHWYDAAGLRIMTHSQTTNSWSLTFQPDSGFRTFYYYDGSDIALTVVRGPSNNYWVGQRYLTGGVDNQLAGRFSTLSGGQQTLSLVGDRSGSTMAAIRPTGVEETNTSYVTHGAFGNLEGTPAGGSIKTQTGFAGASTPNEGGGFVYLRNRWYDPKTGRFLTQDPIGLAGGVNLYAYAGNNPVAFSDPFGLQACKLRIVFICLDALSGSIKYPWTNNLKDLGTANIENVAQTASEVVVEGLEEGSKKATRQGISAIPAAVRNLAKGIPIRPSAAASQITRGSGFFLRTLVAGALVGGVTSLITTPTLMADGTKEGFCKAKPDECEPPGYKAKPANALTEAIFGDPMKSQK
ncbi:MAG: RHS repeat-associated core domain-containing protein, partial [Gemmatimonadota bacterium]